jgi:hypothetical protein
MSVQKEALKNANYYMHRDGHQTLSMKEKIDDYIDSLSDDHFLSIPFSSFDQGASTDWTFDNSARTCVNSTGLSKTLITDTISLSNVIIKSILVKATDKNITVQISKDDGVNFYDVDSYNVDELITADDTLLISFVSGDNTIYEFKILYEQLY